MAQELPFHKRAYRFQVLMCFIICTASLQAQNTKHKINQANKSQPLSLPHITPIYSIEPAGKWTQLFKRQTGWTGGDGIYSIALPPDFNNKLIGRSTNNILFLFSDSIIDTLTDGQQTGNGFTMIHNAVAILNKNPDSENIQFYWPHKLNKKPASIFIPTDIKGINGCPSEDSIYYWLGDAVALNSTKKYTSKDTALAIFAYKITNVSNEPFGFKEIGNDLLLADANFSILKQISLPKIAEGSLGAAIYKEDVRHKQRKKSKDNYVYIYGVRGMHKGLIVARTTLSGITMPETWRYYNGKDWVSDINKCQEITKHVSNELSVTRIKKDKYALIYQLDGIQPYIGLKLAPTPFGPFGPMDTLWHCTEPTDKNKIFVYNAKAHPSLSPKGKLLISYNVNSLDFINQLHKEPTFYRPRFLMLTWK